MTEEAKQLMAAAVKAVTLKGSFCPAELGAKIGLDRFKSIAAARCLSNAGVLELGFDNAAHFTRDFRIAHTPAISADRAARKPATTAVKTAARKTPHAPSPLVTPPRHRGQA